MRGAVGLAALAVLFSAGAVTYVLLDGGSPAHHARPLSTSLSNQEFAGLANPGPGAGSPQRLLEPARTSMAFFAGGSGGTVLPSQQWQADSMTDGSYVLVYVPQGKCLSAARGTLTLKRCDLRLDQRWSHPYLGKDTGGRDYWQLRSSAAGECLTVAGTQWTNGVAAQLQPCSASLPWQQLIAFWSAY
ncbi:MAG: RICIN domain-containing protein [Micromonosporaceae bacterium]